MPLLPRSKGQCTALGMAKGVVEERRAGAARGGAFARRFSAKPELDLDALMSANRWRDTAAAKPKPETPASASSLDALMSKNR